MIHELVTLYPTIQKERIGRDVRPIIETHINPNHDCGECDTEDNPEPYDECNALGYEYDDGDINNCLFQCNDNHAVSFHAFWEGYKSCNPKAVARWRITGCKAM